MKIKNIFKKEIKNSTKSKVQSLDKKQLGKVIGGMETTTDDRWQQSGIGHTVTR